MIDPHNLELLTDEAQKEYFVLFALLVGGGKTAWVQKKKLDQLLDLADNAYGIKTPFGKIRLLRAEGKLLYALRRVMTGQYKRLLRSLTEVTNKGCVWGWDREEWRKNVHGVGRKTASFIAMYTQPDPGPIAVVDRLVLAWLRELGYRVPHEDTPGSAKLYSHYETLFVAEAGRRKVSVRQLDQQIWRLKAKKEKRP